MNTQRIDTTDAKALALEIQRNAGNNNAEYHLSWARRLADFVVVVESIQTKSEAMPDGSVMTRQQLYDQFDFLEGLVNSWTLGNIVDKVTELLAAKQQAVAWQRKHDFGNWHEIDQDLYEKAKNDPVLRRGYTFRALYTNPPRAVLDAVRALPAKWMAEAKEIDTLGYGCNSNSIRARAQELDLALARASCEDGPEFGDGCDHEGFAGGCERFGHTVETCPRKPAAQQGQAVGALRDGDARKIRGEWMVCTDPDMERFVSFYGQDVPQPAAVDGWVLQIDSDPDGHSGVWAQKNGKRVYLGSTE